MTRSVKNYMAAGVLLAGAFLAAAVLSAQGKQTFTGKITDDECPLASHEAMQMGPTDETCTVLCVEQHGASYVLYDGEHAYRLSDQKTPKQFAGKEVTVTGTLDAKTSTITVASMVAAK